MFGTKHKINDIDNELILLQQKFDNLKEEFNKLKDEHSSQLFDCIENMEFPQEKPFRGQISKVQLIGFTRASRIDALENKIERIYEYLNIQEKTIKGTETKTILEKRKDKK